MLFSRSFLSLFSLDRVSHKLFELKTEKTIARRCALIKKVFDAENELV